MRLILRWLGIPFVIDGFLPALVGGIIVSVVTWAVSLLLPDAA